MDLDTEELKVTKNRQVMELSEEKKKAKTLLNVTLKLEYYKNNNILDRYITIFDSGRLVIDRDCVDELDNPNERLYITKLSKIGGLK